MAGEERQYQQFPVELVATAAALYRGWACGERRVAANDCAGVELLRVESGKISQVDRSDVPLHIGRGLSPDQRHLLFSQPKEKDSDLMLVEHFQEDRRAVSWSYFFGGFGSRFCVSSSALISPFAPFLGTSTFAVQRMAFSTIVRKSGLPQLE